MKLTGSLAPVLLFGLAAQVGGAAINLVAAPVYLSLLGREGYGLVGFYMMLQAWMILFDFGLSPVVARQLSRYLAGAVAADDAAALLQAAERLFLAMGLIIGAVFFFAGGWLAGHWLGPSHLPGGEVDLALRVVGALLVFRWMAGLYQAALIGLEHQIPANIVILTSAVARAAATWAALVWIGRTPVVFFGVQTVFTLIEAAVSRILLMMAGPNRTPGRRTDWRLLTAEFRFALGLAVSAAIATLIGYADKLALSTALPLGDYGLFSLVVSICGGISMLIPPIANAFQPRLTTLLAQERRAEFTHVYRLSIAVIAALALALAGVIATQPELVVFGWTGQHELARRLSPILTLYAAGTGVSVLLWAPFLLQYAQGLIRLHVIGNLLFGAVWVPCAVWAAFAYGPIGTGAVWLTGNVLFVLIWVPYTHHRLLSPQERRGLTSSTLLRAGLLAAMLAATRLIPSSGFNRLEALISLAGLSLITLAMAVLTSRDLRQTLTEMAAQLRGAVMQGVKGAETPS